VEEESGNLRWEVGAEGEIEKWKLKVKMEVGVGAGSRSGKLKCGFEVEV
jgi:hypothetical protein